MIKQTRTPTAWVTGANVEVNKLNAKGTNALKGLGSTAVAKVDEDGELVAPAASALKAEWTAYRLAQGYTEEQLKGLSKAELQELEDEPEAAEDDE